MTENELAGAPAPEPEATAAPASDTDNSAPEPKPAEPSKTFTQEELDAIVSKRLAREQREMGTRAESKGSSTTASGGTAET